ncbi:MAG: LysR family transcriptional regulator [Reyranellaceae bacterium]
MARLDEIDAFVCVIETGGFTAAAARLGRSPSAVSKLMARLEERLGVRLLQRTTRQMRPTAEGEAYYRQAAALVEELREVETRIGREGSVPRGLLRVTTSVGLGLSQIARLVPEFLRRHPEVRLELNLEDRNVDLVAEGFDIGIRFGRAPDSAMKSRQLGHVARQIFAAPAYVARHGRPRTPQELARHNCLNFNYMNWLNAWPLREKPKGAVREFPVAGNFVADNGELLYQMALQGVGIMRLADFMVADDVAQGRLELLLEAFNPRESVPIYLIWPPQRFEPPRLRAFIDFMVEQFTPAPPWKRRPGER